MTFRWVKRLAEKGKKLARKEEGRESQNGMS